MSDGNTYSGEVKWFEKKKGFGFLTGTDKKDYFVHFSNIEMDGFKNLEKGQKVSFEVKNDVKGAQAIKVKLA